MVQVRELDRNGETDESLIAARFEYLALFCSFIFIVVEQVVQVVTSCLRESIPARPAPGLVVGGYI